jgi:hypothetical protein
MLVCVANRDRPTQSKSQGSSVCVKKLLQKAFDAEVEENIKIIHHRHYAEHNTKYEQGFGECA